MEQDIIKGIARALIGAFGNGHTVYTEKVRQGLKTPCFFVRCESCLEIPFPMGRFFRENIFSVTFYPESEEDFGNNRVMGEIVGFDNPERSLIYPRTEYLPISDNRSDSGAADFLLPQAVYCSAEGTVFPIDGTEIFPTAPTVYESRASAEAYEAADLTEELSQRELAEIRSASAGGDVFSNSRSAFEKTDEYLSDRYKTAIGGTDIDMDIILASITEAVAEAAGVIKERA